MNGRVLMVTSNYPRWAGDSTTPFVLHMAQDLAALGWEIVVLAPHAPGAARSEMLEGIRVERFRYLWPESLQTVCYNGGALGNLRRQPLNFIKLPFLVGSEWAEVRRRLTGRRFDLVHSHWLLPQGYVCSLAAKSLRVPHVATIHGGDVLALRNSMLDRFRRRALAGADCVTVNSSVTRSVIKELADPAANIVRIPMGAAPARADPAQAARLRAAHRRADGPLLLSVGRLVEEKGLGDLLQALPGIVSSRPDASLLVVGDGPERNRFESMARDLGLADRVSFAGWVDSRLLPNYYAAADIFVGPSKRGANGWVEAQGLTFAEALLSGCPVVATASGGIPDLIRDGETGLLVAEGRPDEIARAVLTLASDPAMTARLVESGMNLARGEFTREASALAFSREFQRLMGRASA